MKEFGEYPIDTHLAGIGAALQESSKSSTCLIKAEPGTGKTTRVPLYLLSIINGGILVLEPRRLAARLAAERCAWFLDEACGKQVGFKIRQQSCVSHDTRLTFITEGLFLRLLRNNPILEGVGAVIIDEFHERNIYTDIALALVRTLQQTQRPDLKLIVMSATLDTSALEKYLKNAAIFDIGGRIFPVEIEYYPGDNTGIPMEKKWPLETAAAVKRMMADSRCPGDILVFLTGLREIMALKSMLQKEIPAHVAEILPLAADLPLADQQRVFSNTSTRKIIVSTNVAETSLTIPGITGVIDAGLAKIPSLAPWSGLPTLEIKRISQASAVQRAGRAGRTQEGLVYRLYSKPDFMNREQFTSPDIQRIDISHIILELMNLGYSPAQLPWFEPPEAKNLEAASQLLRMLGAIDETGVITGKGRTFSMLPLHPRLSAIVHAGQATGCGADALAAACLLSEGFVFKKDRPEVAKNDNDEPCDLCVQIDILKADLHHRPDLSPYPIQFLDQRRKTRVLELYRTLAKACGLAPVLPATPTDPRKLSYCLLHGYPDRVAQRREIDHLYNFCQGRGGIISQESFVANNKPRFLAAVDAVEKLKKDAAQGIAIRACSTLHLDILKEDPGKMLKCIKKEEFDREKGIQTLRQELYYGNLKIESQYLAPAAGGQNLARQLAKNWPFPFDNDESLKIYHGRVELLNRYGIPNNCPLFNGEMLETFFEYICEGIDSLKQLAEKPLEYYISLQLSMEDQTLLEAYTPLEMDLKNGKRLKVKYREGKEPWAEVLLQDCFGLKEHPAIIEGRQRIILHLLGPNRRPAQVTGDLTGFWTGSYRQVLKELSRRYPKHHWPENPAQANPVALKRLIK
ncbi:MAG: ATP-dependent helicase HrpB, partial [Acidobacteria bacterium]|nr:ATP-dependent helicase HrpB [Acidobacteriota bacterium]